MEKKAYIALASILYNMSKARFRVDKVSHWRERPIRQSILVYEDTIMWRERSSCRLERLMAEIESPKRC